MLSQVDCYIPLVDRRWTDVGDQGVYGLVILLDLLLVGSTLHVLLLHLVDCGVLLYFIPD